jgi:hypothetical protein
LASSREEALALMPGLRMDGEVLIKDTVNNAIPVDV